MLPFRMPLSIVQLLYVDETMRTSGVRQNASRNSLPWLSKLYDIFPNVTRWKVAKLKVDRNTSGNTRKSAGNICTIIQSFIGYNFCRV